MKSPIRASLTFQDLSSDTKFVPSQSREMLPLRVAIIGQKKTSYFTRGSGDPV